MIGWLDWSVVHVPVPWTNIHGGYSGKRRLRELPINSGELPSDGAQRRWARWSAAVMDGSSVELWGSINVGNEWWEEEE